MVALKRAILRWPLHSVVVIRNKIPKNYEECFCIPASRHSFNGTCISTHEKKVQNMVLLIKTSYSQIKGQNEDRWDDVELHVVSQVPRPPHALKHKVHAQIQRYAVSRKSTKRRK